MKRSANFFIISLLFFSMGAAPMILTSNIQTAPPAAEVCTHFVAVNGNDSNSGTSISAAWKTIQKAASVVTAGNIVCVRGGIYSEVVHINVSGSATGGSIVFQSYPGETAILDGGKLSVPSGWSAMIEIQNMSYIKVKGFEIRNYKTSAQDHIPIGILVAGHGDQIELTDNHIHDIEINFSGADGGNAHGIAVYGNDATPLTGITVSGNIVDHLKLGSSESVVINGNVDGFSITNNLIHDNNNIGIDAIGFEGTSPDPALDQARNGTITGNTVYNINSYGNPAYGNERSAACIYVDGGAQIIIDGNIAHHCNIGMELASEHAGKATSYITAKNNLIYSNTQAGIGIGGYDIHRGSTENCTIINNTLYANVTQGDWGAELFVQYDTRNNVIKNNIIYSNASRKFIESWSDVMSGNTVDNNLYFAPDGGVTGTWIWRGVSYNTFEQYQSSTGNDPNGIAGSNPLFVNANSGNLNLTTTSPAIDRGDDSICPITDQRGKSRPAGTRCDIGAIEYQMDGSENFARFYSQGAYDGWTLEAGENSNAGGSVNATSAKFLLGDDALNRQYRAIVSFSTSATPIPEGAVITSAVLTFRKSGITGTDPFTTHTNLMVDIRKGSFSGNPRLQISDFKAAPTRGNAAQIFNTPVNLWYSAALNSAAYPYINRNGITQFRLRFSTDDNNDFGMDTLGFYSGNAGASTKPQLIVEYYVP
jgi:hypothetical protein